jgi:hypothetical protein
MSKPFFSDPELRERWDVSSMTIYRWERDYPDFPKKHKFNHRNYRAAAEVEEFEARHFGVKKAGAA